LPDLASSDEVVPRMAIRLSQDYFGKFVGSLASGLILAAPFGAIMATVSTYLVVIASGIVRDVYQRFIKPDATEHEMRRLSQWGMIAVGVFAVLLNIWPVTYLQALVVFSSGGAGASFIVPTFMLCYWRRATAPGVIAAMLTGAVTMLVLYLTGFSLADPLIGQATQLRPYFMLGLEPLLWGVTASAIVGVAVSLNTTPPSEKLMHQLFVAPPIPAGEAP
jgi:sodium/pantothenate symporter